MKISETLVKKEIEPKKRKRANALLAKIRETEEIRAHFTKEYFVKELDKLSEKIYIIEQRIDVFIANYPFSKEEAIKEYEKINDLKRLKALKRNLQDAIMFESMVEKFNKMCINENKN